MRQVSELISGSSPIASKGDVIEIGSENSAVTTLTCNSNSYDYGGNCRNPNYSMFGMTENWFGRITCSPDEQIVFDGNNERRIFSVAGTSSPERLIFERTRFQNGFSSYEGALAYIDNSYPASSGGTDAMVGFERAKRLVRTKNFHTVRGTAQMNRFAFF